VPSQDPDQDATQAIGGTTPTPDATQRIDRTEGYEARGFEGETPLRDEPDADAPYDGYANEPPPEDEAGGMTKGRIAAIAAGTFVLGFIIAFIVFALGTSGDADEAELAAAREDVAELESAVDERDAQIADLEARLAEAEAAAGARADDIESQRQALDERAANLDDREAALGERAEALDQREQEIEQRERDADTDDGSGPGLDEETAEGIVDRVVDQIRELFQGD
jgi:hypothetical protein